MLRIDGGRLVGMAPTLTETLRAAAKSPDGGLRFLDRKEQVTAVSWAALLEGASRVASGLHALGLQPGERVGLIFPTNLSFFGRSSEPQAEPLFRAGGSGKGVSRNPRPGDKRVACGTTRRGERQARPFRLGESRGAR